MSRAWPRLTGKRAWPRRVARTWRQPRRSDLDLTSTLWEWPRPDGRQPEVPISSTAPLTWTAGVLESENSILQIEVVKEDVFLSLVPPWKALSLFFPHTPGRDHLPTPLCSTGTKAAGSSSSLTFSVWSAFALQGQIFFLFYNFK